MINAQLNVDWRKAVLSFKGRIGRQTFWTAWLLMVILGAVSRLNFYAELVVSLGLIYPQFCIYAQRLHDMGRSAWWVLLPMVAAFGGSALAMGIVGVQAAQGGAATLGYGLVGLVLLIVLGFLFWVGTRRGDPGSNRFGPPASGEALATETFS